MVSVAARVYDLDSGGRTEKFVIQNHQGTGL